MIPQGAASELGLNFFSPITKTITNAPCYRYNKHTRRRKEKRIYLYSTRSPSPPIHQ